MMFGKTLTTTLAALALLALVGSTDAGTIVFSANFEGFGNTDDDTLTTFDPYPPTPAGWTAATQGSGADQSGLNLVGANTVYSFRGINSGLTTNVGVIGALTAGATYVISFQVAHDHGGTLPYSVSLVTFNGAARDDVIANAGATATLASKTGESSSYNLEPVSFSYTSDGTESVLGQDLAIRIFGGTRVSVYDNFSVDVTYATPEPASVSLISLGGLMMIRRRRPR